MLKRLSHGLILLTLIQILYPDKLYESTIINELNFRKYKVGGGWVGYLADFMSGSHV
ncbi:hypothetical protein KKC_07307 [Listeria fleischmannii subsp. coloradonensis]|nr:hypothetical protein KKC_07307 [Listeria fleischmannii subsp. coloradonensis]